MLLELKFTTKIFFISEKAVLFQLICWKWK